MEIKWTLSARRRTTKGLTQRASDRAANVNASEGGEEATHRPRRGCRLRLRSIPRAIYERHREIFYPEWELKAEQEGREAEGGGHRRGETECEDILSMLQLDKLRSVPFALT